MLGIGDSLRQALQRVAKIHGAGAAELAAIDRLSRFEGEPCDVERLLPLAKLAGVDLEWLLKQPKPKRICAWCGKIMAEGTEPATHGICPECEAKQEA